MAYLLLKKEVENNILRITIQLITVLSITLTSNSAAQNVSADFIEQTIEKLSENTTKEIDFSDHADEFEQLRNHPININNTTFNELNQLSFLNEIQINNLFLYIQTYGTIFSLSELLAIDGFDSMTIQKTLPFISIGSPPQKHPIRVKELFSYGRSELIIRYQQVLQKPKGYVFNDSLLDKNPNAGYVGSPQKYVFRYKYSFYDRLSFGISGEKDPGEEFFRGSQPTGMDFYSGYLSLTNTGILKNVTLGNFRAGFGQGLVLGSGISAAVPGTGSIRRASGSIRPSISTNDVAYLRGVASTLRIKNLEISVFYSDHKLDANPINSDSLTREILQISSMNGSGYHRLPKEIQNKNNIRERIYGGNLNYRNNFFSIGATAFRSHWSASLDPRSYPYNRFSFKGNENLNIGSDFQFVVRNIYVFGELGRSMNGGIAWLLGGQFSPDPRMAFTLLYRNYQRNYQDLLSNAIGQNSANANETGFVFTFNAKLFPGFVLSGYADLFQFPWLKYQVDFSTHGSEYQIQGDYSASKYVLMSLRLRIKSKQANISGSQDPISHLAESKTIALRYQLDWSISSSLQMKNRFDILENRKDITYKHYGYLISQGLRLKPVMKTYSLALLYALFDTDSYNERIYTYENDVLYGYSVPIFYGKGIRFSLLADWSPVKWLTLWMKYAQTFYTDRNVIGTGLEEVEGNTKSELTFQLRFRF